MQFISVSLSKTSKFDLLLWGTSEHTENLHNQAQKYEISKQ
jgi:hypothetical protein